MNYGKLTAGTTKTAIDTAKPSEKGEIITYLSRMGDVLHDVAERSKIVVTFQTVHTVIDGDQPDTTLPQNLHDLTDFQIVAPQAAHVLYDDGLHPSGLDFLHHRQKARTVKTGSRYAVIGEVCGVRQPIPAGKLL